jgi:ornithine cyclodeaminase/alanine dehydrogenase-like protein (mu-crystallin family)
MYISEHEVRALLTYEPLIPAIREALIDFSAGRVEQPLRTILRAGNAEGQNNGWFASMPVIAGDVMGVKAVTFFAGNTELGLHTHMATITLLSRATGEPLAIMDGRLITEMRTAAVSAVALEALAPALFPSAPVSLGIVGSGVQARSHLTALRMVCPTLRDIRIWSRNRTNAERLAAESGGRAALIEDAASADVVLTATMSSTPVLEGRWLGPRALVIGVGAVGGTMRELDDEVMRTSWLVAESRVAAERDSGDVKLSGTKVQAEIGQILADPSAFEIPRDGRILFKSVGMAIEDLAAARIVWKAYSSEPKRARVQTA